MEDKTTTNNTNTTTTSTPTKRDKPNEAVRSRWTPKPEQILILESIFNSGMVNPPKEETIRIRKLLEKFGVVGDANVFYWFQNRRSRSRRRQRQLQATLSASVANQPSTMSAPLLPVVGGLDYGGSLISLGFGLASSSGSDSTSGFRSCVEDVYGSLNGKVVDSTPSSSIFASLDSTNLEFSSGIVTVFVNGVATQVPEGPLNVKAMFGDEVVLVHSSGVPVPFNEFGISFQSLQQGENYFLVPRLS